MKSAKMSTIVVLALGLMVWPASVAHGKIHLTVNGQPVASITLELGQSCTVEVVSDDSMSYEAYVGFDNRVVLGTFSHLKTTEAAGSAATVTEYNEKAFYGYEVVAAGDRPPPSKGVHFVFEYEAQKVGETELKLYLKDPPPSAGPLLDSVRIKVIPLSPKPMGTAFTYQGRLLDAGKPADGLYDFEFELYDNPGPFAAQEGTTIDINDLDVIDGQFVVELDFGSDVFAGDARWLETTVAQSDGSDPATLTPRVELTPTPYAIYAKNAGGDGDWTISGNNMYSAVSGNVGIGTTSPLSKLSVGGIGIADTGVYGSGNDAGVHGVDSGSGSYGKLGYGGIGVYGAGGNYGVIGEGAVYGVKGTDSDTGSYGRLGNDNWGGYFGGDGYFSGNVGIGTSDPVSKLEVKGRLELPGNDANGTPGTGVIEIGNSLRLDDNEIITNTDQTLFLQRDNNGDLSVDNGTLIVDASLNNVGIGTTSPTKKLTVRGNILVQSESTGATVMQLGEGLDYAEGFDVSHKNAIGPGSVLIIDADNPGKLAISDKPYDSKVAGIVAGAKGQGSGVRLGGEQFDFDVALAGRVYCNVDATEAAVQPGDLLTTSAKPGYAMKAADYMRAQGAILGKAMESLEKGQKGQILVLVTLQ